MRFYLGTHKAVWLERLDVPLFISRRTLEGRKSLPRARAGWALDSGGFTELHGGGRWSISAAEYAAQVDRYAAEIGRLEWVAPMDWMCEPSVRAQTGLSVAEHQARTVANFGELRDLLGPLVIPVVQGWTLAEFTECVARYYHAGHELHREPVVGVGSICRRGQTLEICRVVRTLQRLFDLRMHGFGVRGEALHALGDVLTSADSMAWSYAARRSPPLRACTHARCSNCPRYAMRWRDRLLAGVQPRLFDHEGVPT